jgi:cyclic dehypoxanthinyl futalosine synthase
VTQGREIGQLALLYGANDMGSLMIEENVVSAAGTVHHLTLEQIRSAISELGWIPKRRNVFYELFEDEPAAGGATGPIAGGVALPVLQSVP